MNNAERNTVVDRYRGFLVFSMVFFELLKHFPGFGFLSRIASHNSITGIKVLPTMNLADIIFPCFILAIAMNIIPSFNRRMAESGKAVAYRHFLERGLSLTGISGILRSIALITGNRKRFFFFRYLGFGLSVLTLILGVVWLLSLKVKALKKASKKLSESARISLYVVGAANILYGIHNAVALFILNRPCLYTWNPIHALGFSILLMIPALEWSTLKRGIYGCLILVVYTGIYSLPNVPIAIDEEVQGGFVGGFAWASMMILFTVFSDLYYKDLTEEKCYRSLASLGGATVIGLIGFRFFPISMGSVSPGFVAVNLPISIFIFLLVSLTKNLKPSFSPVLWWGKNPLLIYLLQFLLINIPVDIIPGFKEIGWFPASIFVVFMISLFTFIVYKLDTKNRIVKF